MTLSFFITVIPDHDKPQPPGCLLGGMLALMIKLLPWLLLAIAVVWVIKAIKAPKVPKYQRYDRWRY